MSKLQYYNEKNEVNMNSELKNLKNQAIKEGEEIIMNKNADKVYTDTINILLDISRTIEILSHISKKVGDIHLHACMLSLEYDEDSLNHISYSNDRALEMGLNLEKILSQYNSRILQLHEHIGELMEEQGNNPSN